MLIIPAVDLKGGKCVRLIQGQKDREIVYGADPVGMALKWVEEGAKRLHLIDLDGAFEGSPQHLEVLEKLSAKAGVPIEFGGGVRAMDSLHAVLDAGASYVILGTSAMKNPTFLSQAAEEYPGKVLLGIDAKDGEVRVSGWIEGDGVKPEELAARFTDLPLAGIVFTDISKDGMLEGFNPEATGALARAAGIPVIAAGGFSRMNDVEKLLPLADSGVIGAVVGRALYEGTFDLKAALERV
ncbi:MAG: 1-(5-phosphoribosyl)-5-[(5-phosphoribosylamino)methylideneamino]imidazole-4-carboxamide isomerase [Nitrospinaceae bacterium]|jgi:phosphoribosylformimino-5-aminoimidazole carboxamide ribotide isomerase|nr:1-(5-phosphoribosyl)-5-[(5-phosphoribosylamino)methylideneamino]imidazole-4-carboxamide isomerase [Nitrospinaceae bacterium]MBT3434362.1 1-(5-phosphoribosyl)-5-[(5-phosphoribosylamino)methylideneamino]imidazole-4-carboxamide isomerase [Nitrospinaceae bacterium]MBT3821231.1 1-(5-phosphoribosyl)-5-[(5-phosphoribosylamino)methylideneamino]imidazole-4-carboxamide isomerase [Nitrospinaceae bacterium]MBT4093063.1 1-(5-phosphoribosyl)-5-[(5-phosphoribosylamino)methylideneamino]imidazole-4-carboxamid